jgi:hypothetical protein
VRTKASVLLVAAVTIFAALPVFGQKPVDGQEGSHLRRPLPKIVNLQVLPKNTPAEEVIRIMRGFEGQLGVECKFCHTPDEKTHRLNYASDAKPEKAAARQMMAMTHEINSKYLKQLPEMHHDHEEDADHEEHAGKDEHGEHGEHVARVTCGTCHRGHSHPETFVPPPDEEHEQGQRPHNQHQLPPEPQK